VKFVGPFGLDRSYSAPCLARCRFGRSGVKLGEALAAPLLLARRERAAEGIGHLRQAERLVRGDRAAACRGRDRRHRADEIGRAVDRRQGKLDRPPAARPEDAVETEPQRRGIAGQRQLDRLPGQPLASPSSSSAAARVVGLGTPRGRPTGLPDRPLRNRPRPSRPTCSPVLAGPHQASPHRSSATAPADGRPNEVEHTVRL